MALAFSERFERALCGRNPALDFLRGLAILMVCILHFSMVYEPTGPLQNRFFSFYLYPYLSRNGYLGVSAFFVISGYLITSGALTRYGTLRKISFFDFYLFRFARIVPPLLLLFATSVGLHFMNEPAFVFQNLDKVSLRDLLIGVFTLRLHLYWTVPVIGLALGVLWSLSIEEAFYLFFPPLCRVLRKTSLLVGLLLGLMIYAVIFRFQMGYPTAAFSYFGCFDLLALGCLIALFKSHYPKLAQLLKRAWLTNFAWIGAFALYVAADARENSVFMPLMMGFVVALLILSAQPVGYTSRSAKWIRLMGVYSYEMYLFHTVVMQLMYTYVLQPLNETSTFASAVDIFFFMTMAATFGIAALISEFYSEPARRFIKRIALSWINRHDAIPLPKEAQRLAS